MNVARPRLTRADIAELQRYDWPGNVRELQHVLQRAAITSRDGRLRVELPQSSALADSAPSPSAVSADMATPFVPDVEMTRRQRENILAALEHAGWKIYGPDGAAELLGIRPTTLASRMKKLGLRRPSHSMS
jgi:transcriptional regulator with GAF, ATPase, and Fis domain